MILLDNGKAIYSKGYTLSFDINTKQWSAKNK